MPSYVIRARAPLRVSFAGGGTDVPPFPEREGGLVLNATINRHAFGTLRPRDDDQIGIESLDFGLALQYGAGDAMPLDGQLDLAKAAIGRLANGDRRGFDLLLHSTAPPGSGLGSSSTMMVALIGLLREFHTLPLTDYEVAHLAYVLEREDLGLRGGLQDQYAATFGGFNFIEFEGDRVIVNPLRIKRETMNELEHNMLLCFTGATRVSDGIIGDQTARLEEGNEGTLDGLRTQKQLAIEMKNALLRGRLTLFAQLLDDAWQAKKQLSPRITTDAIDEIYEEAKAHGALGGKVTGAGGGGYMLFYCDYRRRHTVAARLEQLGVSIAEFAFESGGLETWRVNDG